MVRTVASRRAAMAQASTSTPAQPVAAASTSSSTIPRPHDPTSNNTKGKTTHKGKDKGKGKARSPSSRPPSSIKAVRQSPSPLSPRPRRRRISRSRQPTAGPSTAVQSPAKSRTVVIPQGKVILQIRQAVLVKEEEAEVDEMVKNEREGTPVALTSKGFKGKGKAAARAKGKGKKKASPPRSPLREPTATPTIHGMTPPPVVLAQIATSASSSSTRSLRPRGAATAAVATARASIIKASNEAWTPQEKEEMFAFIIKNLPKTDRGWAKAVGGRSGKNSRDIWR